MFNPDNRGALPRLPSKREPCCLCPRRGLLTRGLCQFHYKSAAIDVKAGATTWEDLEKQGRARPPIHRNRRFAIGEPHAPST